MSSEALCRASDGLPLPETKPEHLRKELAVLLENLKCPEKPAAVCCHINCIKLQEKQEEKPYLPLPTTSIYLSNPILVQYTTIACLAGCVINFHNSCWEELKLGELKCRRPRDKDYLGFPCPTPDCGGAIIEVSIKGKDGKVIKRIKESKLEKEKRNRKKVVKKESLLKEEGIKKPKLEGKVAKTMLKTQVLKEEQEKPVAISNRIETAERSGDWGDRILKI